MFHLYLTPNSLFSFLLLFTFLFIESIVSLGILDVLLFCHIGRFLIGLWVEGTFFKLLLILLFRNLYFSIVRLVLPFWVTVHEMLGIIYNLIGLINLRIVNSPASKVLFIQVLLRSLLMHFFICGPNNLWYSLRALLIIILILLVLLLLLL